MFDGNEPRQPTLEEVDAELARTSQTASEGGQGLALLVVSLVLFFGAQQTFGDAHWSFFAVLVVVLLVHELGHLAAMRLFGFRDLRMFFIPFFGAAAAGKKPDATGTQRAIVALAGPLPGIILGCAGLLAVIMGGVEIGPTTAEFLALLLVLNFFNLLPILPFDGGRFVNIVLFSRWPTAEMVFRLLTSAALVWFAVETSSWILGGIGVFIAVGSSINARYAGIAQELRANIPAPHPSSVPGRHRPDPRHDTRASRATRPHLCPRHQRRVEPRARCFARARRHRGVAARVRLLRVSRRCALHGVDRGAVRWSDEPACGRMLSGEIQLVRRGVNERSVT